MTPSQNRSTLQELKGTMVRMKNYKKEKMDRLRYNYLVSKCYHKEEQLGNQDSRGVLLGKTHLNTK